MHVDLVRFCACVCACARMNGAKAIYSDTFNNNNKKGDEINQIYKIWLNAPENYAQRNNIIIIHIVFGRFGI